MKLLVVKTSSMGDLVHALPAITDMAAQVSGLTIDWLAEKPFDAIAALHPAVRRVWPMAWRQWRKRLWAGEVWQSMGALRQGLRAERYDLVLDLQGLAKSLLWARQAGAPVAGYDRASAREAWAALGYQRHAAVSPALHAIVRNRRLAAAHLGYAVPAGAPRFGLRAPAPAWLPATGSRPLAVLVPMASRPAKLWPEGHWLALARALADQGLAVTALWGSRDEGERAQRIVREVGGDLPPFLSIADTAALLGHARLVVGLDTGFTHLAAALGVATVGLYRTHDPAVVGVTGDGFCASLGGPGQPPPEVSAVLALALQGLQAQPSSSRSAG
jgi:heptosyltransferase-1